MSKQKLCNDCVHVHKQDDCCATGDCACTLNSYVVPTEAQLKIWAHEFALMRHDAMARFLHYLGDAYDNQSKIDKAKGYKQLAVQLSFLSEYLDVAAGYANAALTKSEKYMLGKPAYIPYLDGSDSDDSECEPAPAVSIPIVVAMPPITNPCAEMTIDGFNDVPMFDAWAPYEADSENLFPAKLLTDEGDG